MVEKEAVGVDSSPNGSPTLTLHSENEWGPWSKLPIPPQFSKINTKIKKYVLFTLTPKNKHSITSLEFVETNLYYLYYGATQIFVLYEVVPLIFNEYIYSVDSCRINYLHAPTTGATPGRIIVIRQWA